MSIILDTWVTMAWCFADEATAYTESVFDRVRDEGAVVPAIWPLEVANSLRTGERRQRVSEAETTGFLDLLRDLSVYVDTAAFDVLGSILALSREHGLSSYDAAYLELAIRERRALATLDQRLRSAAERVGVSLVE